jgi:hypothetical protein
MSKYIENSNQRIFHFYGDENNEADNKKNFERSIFGILSEIKTMNK